MPFSKSSTWTTVVLSASCQQIMKISGRIGVTAICTVSEVPLKGPSAVVSVITVSDSKWRWWTQLPKCASYTWPTAGKWVVDMGSSFLLLPLRRCRNYSCSGDHNAKRQPCGDTLTLMFCMSTMYHFGAKFTSGQGVEDQFFEGLDEVVRIIIRAKW